MNNMIDRRIVDFIKRHHILTLATAVGEQIWCSNLFYAFDCDGMRLIFSSAESSRHIEQALISKRVACSIVLESRVVARLQGAQIEGVFAASDDDQCRKLYLKRFPFAALNLDKLWSIEITSIKYTDNTLGFGKKLYFQR